MWILEGHKKLRQEINVVSKYAKMEFLPSHGRKDLWGLVNLHNKFFNSQNIAVHEKVEVTMFLLIGKAQLWVNKLKQELDYSRMCLRPIVM